jgi:hypothetical protein
MVEYRLMSGLVCLTFGDNDMQRGSLGFLFKSFLNINGG